MTLGNLFTVMDKNTLVAIYSMDNPEHWIIHDNVREIPDNWQSCNVIDVSATSSRIVDDVVDDTIKIIVDDDIRQLAKDLYEIGYEDYIDGDMHYSDYL